MCLLQMLKAPFKATEHRSNFIKICLQTPKGLPNMENLRRHRNELKMQGKGFSNGMKKKKIKCMNLIKKSNVDTGST